MGIKTKLIQVWISLRSSFWFIPAVMILLAVALAVTLVEVDTRTGVQLTETFPRLLEMNPEGAGMILSIIATAMIGVAGVAFSITIVALSLASAQYTPRVLRNFMRDPANQIVLGVFVSVFVYCLIVLRTVRNGAESFVPPLSVAAGIVLSIVGVGFLIFFIHHVASSIQASTILARIGRETVAVIDSLYPEKHAGEPEDSNEVEAMIQDHSWTEIPSAATGYIQNMDEDGLMAWAEQQQTMVRMKCGFGEFVIADQPVLAIAGSKLPKEKCGAELNAFIGVASFRTNEQDVAFGIRQLVDIALKALSPGLNDTTTAVTCLRYLGGILARVSRRKIPGAVRRRQGAVRLIARPQAFPYLVDEALNQIRQEAKGNVAIHLALLETIAATFNSDLSHFRREVLHTHLARIKRVADDHVKDPDDKKVIALRLQEVEKLLRSAV